jgi:hypothetical protein
VQQQAGCCQAWPATGCGVAVVADALYLLASTIHVWMPPVVMCLAMIVIASLHLVAIAFGDE